MTLEERIGLVAEAERDENFRAMFLRLIDDEENGDAFFINACCMTYDPRNGPNGKPIGEVPFLLWEAQESAANEIGKAIDGGYDAGFEKSRDMGVTWIILCCIVRRWLRKRGFSALIGSMTEGLVDDGKSPASLGWKIDFIIDNLPPFLKPKGFIPREHRSWGNWVNPDVSSTISGRAPTPRFPVGDRKSVIYYDDWAQWEHGLSAWENAAATTNCRLASWTVNRDDPLNHAYQLSRSKAPAFENVKTRIIHLHWSDDPRKQKMAICPITGKEYNIWRREMVGDKELGIPGKMSEEQFLRDYEMVYEIAAKGLIYSRQLPYVRIGKFPYDKKLPLWTSWDYGRTDSTVIIWWQYDPFTGRMRIVDCVKRNGFGAGYYIPFVLGTPENILLEFEKDYTANDFKVIERRDAWKVPGYGVRYASHYGDPSGKAKSLSHGVSVAEVLRDKGIYVIDRDNNRDKSYRGRIDDARYLLPFCDIDEDNCKDLIDALTNYKWNNAGTAPEHDDHSHACAAFEYGAVNLIRDFKSWSENRVKSEEVRRAGLDPAVFGDPRSMTDPRLRNRGDNTDLSSYSGGRRSQEGLSRAGY
jgi:hypothetical protein